MATELLENTIATLKVLRTSDQGAFLDGQTGNTNDDILLHKDQQTSPVTIGDEVEVFLYRDPKGAFNCFYAFTSYEGWPNWLC